MDNLLAFEGEQADSLERFDRVDVIADKAWRLMDGSVYEKVCNGAEHCGSGNEKVRNTHS